MSFPRSYRRTVTDRASAAGDQARARVLEVALDLFAANGYRGTSIAQVAELAGLSQSGLLHHFPSKVALLVAALEHRDEKEGRLLESAEDKPQLGWAAFDALIGLVERNSRRPNQVRLFVTLSAEAIEPTHPAHEWVQQHYAGIIGWLTAALEHARASGELRADVPIERLVHQTVAVMDGLQIQWLVSGCEIDMVGDFGLFVADLRHRWSVRA